MRDFLALASSPLSLSPHIQILATEMELLFRYDKAAVYHQERVASCKHDASVWHDYSLFLMRSGEPGKAEECAKETIALRVRNTTKDSNPPLLTSPYPH